ncbi:MAG: hypothetical protein H7122_12540 [Chitinophagaceae bacterium]|nr:hypothetical protein [Chitinophagaceae bacterium]
MIRRLWTAVILFLFIVPGVFSQKKPVLSPDEFEQQINQAGIQLLDVRTSEEYAGGHIKNALQANWLNKGEFRERVMHLDKASPLYVYCGSGVRSNDAAKWFRNEGFQRVFELQHGFAAWKKNNKPIESDTVVRQISIKDYESMLKTSSLLLVDMGAKWCPACKKMEPVLEQLQTDLPGKFGLIKIDAGIHTSIMQELGVETLPTFILYKNGKECWRKEGLLSLEELKSQIR